MSVDQFFEFARERYDIHLLKLAGKPKPWTKDPVLQSWFFCNIFREDDKTTQWFRQHVRDPLKHDRDVLLATIAFRWFNRIETCEKILDLFFYWDSASASRVLKGVKPLVTGAYIIKTPDGMNKLDGVLMCINNVVNRLDHTVAAIEARDTLQEAHEFFLSFPFLGNFMAYEIVTDLRHTYLLENATDIMEWACPGPGCARGLGWVVADDPDLLSYSSKKDAPRMLDLMRELLLCSTFDFNWPTTWPKWEMREVEHTLCEYDKWRRGSAGQRLKRKYA